MLGEGPNYVWTLDGAVGRIDAPERREQAGEGRVLLRAGPRDRDELPRHAPADTLGQELRSLKVPAALTSELGPLPGGGWGPRQAAVLAWKSACAC